VRAQEQDVVLAERGGEGLDVELELELAAVGVEDEVVAPGGGVEDGGDAVGDSEPLADACADPRGRGC
jgi:hypothetical protein